VRCAAFLLPALRSMLAFAAALDERRIAALLTLMMQEQ
jgi:hypothetical protein